MGAVAVASIGFTWGGWQTNAAVENREAIAVIKALTPVCLENFNRAPDAQAKLITLKAIGSSWQRETFVKEGKWAMVGNSLNSRVVDACAEALFNLHHARIQPYRGGVVDQFELRRAVGLKARPNAATFAA